MNDKELISPESIPGLVATWQVAEAEIRSAFAMMKAASERLQAGFGGGRYGCRIEDNYGHSIEFEDPDRTIKRLSQSAWTVLMQRMDLRRCMSMARAQEMDREIADGKLPPITEQNLRDILFTTLERVPEFMEEAIAETIRYLMPPRQEYVSTSPFVIGKKVILKYAVERGYGTHWRVDYHRTDKLRGLDNTFHILDGKGVVRSHCGPLVDAIASCLVGVDAGETDYFRFRCHLNQNLHVEFKRKDLVDLLNQRAAGPLLDRAHK